MIIQLKCMWHLLLQFTNNRLRIAGWCGALSVPLKFIPPCKMCSEEVTVLFLSCLQGSTIVKKRLCFTNKGLVLADVCVIL